MEVKLLSRVRLLATPWIAAYQAPPMGFSRQEYWSGLHCLPAILILKVVEVIHLQRNTVNNIVAAAFEL